MSLGTGEPPSSQVWAGRCHLGPFPDWRWPQPWPAASVPLTHVCPSPASFKVSFPVSFCFPFFPPFLVSGSVPYFCRSLHLRCLPLFSSSLGLTGSSSRRLPASSPSWGPPPSPRSTFQPPPPPRRPSPEPAAAVVGSRDAAGRLELKKSRSGAGGGAGEGTP